MLRSLRAVFVLAFLAAMSCARDEAPNVIADAADDTIEEDSGLGDGGGEEVPGCADNDGDGVPGSGSSCDPSDPYFDCDDADPTVSPLAPESCDGIDNNCDGEVDEGSNGCGGCEPLDSPPGQVCGDCGRVVCDTSAATHCEEGLGSICGGCEALDGVPGQRCGECGTYVCTGPDSTKCVDEPPNTCGGCGHPGTVPGDPCGDCGDGVWECVTTRLTCTGALGPYTFYVDRDGDGVGVDDSWELCESSGSYVALECCDCDDGDPAVHPEAIEFCDLVDNDCDDLVDEDTDLLSDPSNCGACGAACPDAPNAAPACSNGSCGLTCEGRWHDANGDPADGCECLASDTTDVTCDSVDDDCDGLIDDDGDCAPDCGWADGLDYGGADFTVAPGMVISGRHKRISTLTLPEGITLSVAPFDGSETSGWLEVCARSIVVAGTVLATVAGPTAGTGPWAGGAGSTGTNGSSGCHDSDGWRAASGANGEAGGAGGYAAPSVWGDTSTDERVWMGSGGGHGGAGGAGGTATCCSLSEGGSGGGSGGQGGRGGGAVTLRASTRIVVSGQIVTTGGPGSTAGVGGTGACSSARDSGGGSCGACGGCADHRYAYCPGMGPCGSAQNDCCERPCCYNYCGGNGGVGGRGGAGAGGGILLKAPSVSVSGTLDARGGGASASNGGSIKIFYRGAEPGGARLGGGEWLAVY